MNMSDNIKDLNINVQNNQQRNINILDTVAGLFLNNYHTFVVRKTERLASALYVITGFMPPEEPVRTRLRVCAIELITRSSNPLELAETGAETFEFRCSEITIILQTAHYAGLISETNAQLIGEEYAALATFVRAHSGRIAERGRTLKRASVTDPKSVASSIRQSSKRPLSDLSENRDKVLYRKSNDFDNRKSIILSLFGSKNPISIKDTASLIPGVSEKTLQRDLMSLVEKGVLVKNGSRRWTTYSRAGTE